MDYDPMVMDEAETVGPVIKISQACCSALCCLSHLPLPSPHESDPRSDESQRLTMLSRHTGRLDARQIRAL